MQITVADATLQFLDTLSAQGLAESTVGQYRKSLTGRYGFLVACQGAKKDYNVTMGQVDESCTIHFFKAHQGGVGGRNNKLVHVRRFLNWAEKRRMLRGGVTAEGILDGQKHRKAVRKPKLYIEAKDFPSLLDAAGNYRPKDRAALAVFLYTLVRQSELIQIRLKDLDLDALTLEIYRVKTHRYTQAGITPALAREMEEWLSWYAGQCGYDNWRRLVAEQPDWYLIPGSPTGKGWHGITPDKPISAPERIMHRALASLGYWDTKGEGCHTIRRSGARAMFKYLKESLGFDGALVRVQAMLDHENPQMTLLYIGMNQEKDELNEWLKGNDMYGELKPARSNVMSNVIQYRGRAAR